MCALVSRLTADCLSCMLKSWVAALSSDLPHTLQCQIVAGRRMLDALVKSQCAPLLPKCLGWTSTVIAWLKDLLHTLRPLQRALCACACFCSSGLQLLPHIVSKAVPKRYPKLIIAACMQGPKASDGNAANCKPLCFEADKAATATKSSLMLNLLTIGANIDAGGLSQAASLVAHQSTAQHS